MQRSWFFSRLIVLVCCWALLAISLPAAQAATQRAVRCPPAGCGPPPPPNPYYHPTGVTHNLYGNLSYQRSKPSSADFLSAAAYLEEWASQAQKDGTIAAKQTYLLNQLAAFYNAQPNTTAIYNAAAAFGNQVPASGWGGALGNITLAQRQWFVSYVQTYGLYNTILTWAQFLRQLGGQFGVDVIPNGAARGIFDGIALFGTVLMATGDPIGILFVVGGGVGIIYMEFAGM